MTLLTKPHLLQQDDEHGPKTDKHALGYVQQYEKIALETAPGARILEIGVFRGASLRLWHDLFPGCVAVGVDNGRDAWLAPEKDISWPPMTVKVVSDQDDPALPGKLRSVNPHGWDLIVDDASHQGSLSRRTFELLWPLVKPGSWYALEDWFAGMNGDPFYEGDSMLRLAMSFVESLGHLGSGIAELRYVRGLALVKKAE